MRSATHVGYNFTGIFNKQASKEKRNREGTGCCKSARVQGEQAVAEGMLRQVHVHKELLVGSRTKGNGGCRLFWGRPKKSGE